MNDIVDEVLKVEDEAKELIQEALKNAALKKSALENEVSQKIKDAREQAQKLIHDSADAAREKADLEYKQAIQRAEKENTDFMNRNKSRIETIVNQVTDLVITPEYKKE